jgi:hypothetical protein
VLRDHSSVGLAAALFRESIMRVAMIGITNWLILFDKGCRQSPGGCINFKERKRTLRARSGPVAEMAITISRPRITERIIYHLPGR